MHLRQQGFTCSVCGPFNEYERKNTKNEYKNLQSKLDKARFQHDMAYLYFKDTHAQKASDKALRDKAFNVAKKPKHDEY